MNNDDLGESCMSDLCLLAASLLNQGQFPGWQQSPLRHPLDESSLAVGSLQPQPWQLVGTQPKQTVLERLAPEFSQSDLSEDCVATTHPTGNSPDSLTLLERNSPQSAHLEAELATADSPLSSTESSAESASGTSFAAQSIAYRPNPVAIAPSMLREVLQASIALPELADPLAYLPQPIPNPTHRPTTGSQLYHQRLAALSAGRTYTRLATDSFWPEWINATDSPTYEQWISLLAQEAQAMARGQGNNALTVLVGDSISQWFPVEHLSNQRFWLNQGISGDTTAGVLRRLSAFQQARPDTIHVMVGINDVKTGVPDEQILSNLQQIMHQLRQSHPNATIYIHSILPTRRPDLPSDRILALNQAIESLTIQEEVHYLDLLTYFSDGSGHLRPELTTDGLHLNSQGYSVWDRVMRSLTSA